MTERLEEAIAKVRKLPRDRQDEAAELLLSVVQDNPDALRLTPEQVAEVERRLEQPSRYAGNDDVRAFFQHKATT